MSSPQQVWHPFITKINIFYQIQYLIFIIINKLLNIPHIPNFSNKIIMIDKQYLKFYFLSSFFVLLITCNTLDQITQPSEMLAAVPCTDPNCKQCWPLDQTQCGKCKDGFVGDNVQNICADCKQKITNCTSCSYNSFTTKYQCSVCEDQFYPYPSINNCTNCVNIFNNCIHCKSSKEGFTTYLSCDQCAQGFQKNYKGQCIEQSSNIVIIIVSIIGGVLLLSGIGFVLSKYFKNKKKLPTLLSQDDQQ